jgi:hypothetical protein
MLSRARLAFLSSKECVWYCAWNDWVDKNCPQDQAMSSLRIEILCFGNSKGRCKCSQLPSARLGNTVIGYESGLFAHTSSNKETVLVHRNMEARPEARPRQMDCFASCPREPHPPTKRMISLLQFRGRLGGMPQEGAFLTATGILFGSCCVQLLQHGASCSTRRQGERCFHRHVSLILAWFELGETLCHFV